MRISAVALAIVLALPAAAQTRGNPEISFEGQSVDAMLAAFMRENGVAGMSVAIVQAPYVTRATGLGIADRRSATLVSANTMFNIAQMRHAFTAVAAMQLVESGKLSLDTVRPLIRGGREADLVAMIEKASGESYRAFVRRGQIERLGLRHTLFAADLAAAPHESVAPGESHRRFLREAALIDPTEPAAGNGGSAGPSDPNALYSSASDISVWDIALAGEVLIRDAALRKVLYEPVVLENGEKVPSSGPWFFPGHPGLMIATGSAEGFSSLLSRFTKKDELVCVTLLANREGLDLTQLARRIAGAYNARLGPPASAAGKSVQQSPYSVAETFDRLVSALNQRGIAIREAARDRGSLQTADGEITVWEENGETWLAGAGPKPARAVDEWLLAAISVP